VRTIVFTDLESRDSECLSRLNAELSVPKSLERVVVHCRGLSLADYFALGDGEQFLSLFARVKKFDFVDGQPPARFWAAPDASVEKMVTVREIRELSLGGHLVAPLNSFR
jgi:hypothetical protein